MMVTTQPNMMACRRPYLAPQIAAIRHPTMFWTRQYAETVAAKNGREGRRERPWLCRTAGTLTPMS